MNYIPIILGAMFIAGVSVTIGYLIAIYLYEWVKKGER